MTYGESLVDVASGWKSGGPTLMGKMGGGMLGALKNQLKLMKGQLAQTSKGTQNQASRRQSAMQIEMKKGKHERAKGVHVKRTSIANDGKRVMRDTVSIERPMIGGELIPSIASNRLPAVSLKLGKRLGPVDGISPFLKNLQQNAKVSCQYGGRFKSHDTNASDNPMNFQGERMVVSQVFRHCWSNKDFYTPTVATPGEPSANTDGYPDVTGNSTQGPVCYNVAYPHSAQNQLTIASPYYPHTHGNNNFAMLSRPDMEDMMWNLNKLKLINNRGEFNNNVYNAGQSVGGFGLYPNFPDMPMFHRNFASFQENRHFRISAIMANNSMAVTPTTSTSSGITTFWNETPYKFNSVFRHGTVKYDFKNTEITGARVEVIVYKGKKGQFSSDAVDDFSTANAAKGNKLLDNIAGPIGQGYISSVVDKMGTEDMGGRTPLAEDILTNPTYPLLPELKKTIQGDMMYKEVSRTAFALTSGASRTLEVVLPGDEYDPANIPNTSTPVYPGETGSGITGYAICDEHTYTIAISVCGVKMSRLATTIQTASNLPEAHIVGEIHCPFNVEYLCTYTEHIGACKYKTPPPVNLYNDAIVCDTSVKPFANVAVQCPVTAITVIPLENTVRNTDKVLLPPAITGGMQNERDTGHAGQQRNSGV